MDDGQKMFHRYAELQMQNYRTAQVSIWHVSVVSFEISWRRTSVKRF